MMSSRFDLDSTSKILNLSFLWFNKRSEFQNYAHNTNPFDHTKAKYKYTHGDYEKLQILTYIWSFSSHGIKLALDILRPKARTKIKSFLYLCIN